MPSEQKEGCSRSQTTKEAESLELALHVEKLHNISEQKRLKHCNWTLRSPSTALETLDPRLPTPPSLLFSAQHLQAFCTNDCGSLLTSFSVPHPRICEDLTGSTGTSTSIHKYTSHMHITLERGEGYNIFTFFMHMVLPPLVISAMSSTILNFSFVDY